LRGSTLRMKGEEARVMATPRPTPASNEVFEQSSFLHGPNAVYIENLYEQYRADPQSVDESWRAFFSGISDRMASARARTASWARKDFPETDEAGRPQPQAKPAKPAREATVHELQQRVAQLAPATTPQEARRAVIDTVRAIQMI